MPAEWRSVPMPSAIAALPRTAGGMPVPFNTSWGEDPERLAYLPETGLTIVCDCVPGQGKPLFSVQCPERQRRCAVEGLCSVCGTRIENDEPRAFAGAPVFGSDLYIEAAAHIACLAYALRVCPHLVGNTSPEDPIILSPIVVTQEGRRIDHPGAFGLVGAPHGEPGVRALPLVFVLSQPLLPTVMSRTDFLTLVSPAK